MTVSQKYLEFISLVKALNTIVLGDNTAEVTLDGITKPSISKFLAQVDALTTAELQRLRDAINIIMNQQSVPTTVVNDGTHSQEWINSDFRAALLALNNWINTKGLPNGYASLDANGTIPKAQLPIDAIPQATETVAGKAKIATTVIAKAGVNDTDFITAKKLRDALNAGGNAPVSACRAWVLYDSTVTPLVIRASFNIASVTYLGGNAESLITFINEMPSANFVAVGSCGGGESVVDGTAVNTNYGAPPTTKTCRVGLKDAGGGGNRKYVSVAFFA